MPTYHILISIDLGAVFPPVKDLLKQVNHEVASLGGREELSVRSKAIKMTFESKRELSNQQKELVKKMIIMQFNADHPAWKAKVESFRRKSGNVQPLAS